MKRFFAMIAIMIAALCLTACGVNSGGSSSSAVKENGNSSESSKSDNSAISEIISDNIPDENSNSSKILVVYFSLANEQYEVGVIEKGNTEILAENAANTADYNAVFIGYPIRWGELPTIVKVFLEGSDLSSNTVIPFCTHAGSGLSGTQKSVNSLRHGAAVKSRLAVRGATAIIRELAMRDCVKYFDKYPWETVL